ncbi:MAG: tyrosine-type recombinase/integrase, partial [Acidobacteriota bacterium]
WRPSPQEDKRSLFPPRRPTAENPALVYVASLTTNGGRRSMRQALGEIAEIVSTGRATAHTLDWPSLRYQHTQAIRTALIEAGYKPATVNKALSALRGTLKAAWQMGQMDAESYHRASSVANVKGSSLPAGRDLSEGEIRALMACCSEDDSPAGFRDAALLAVLCLGLRRAEAVALDCADDAEAASLKVRGKGRKERLAYACEGASEALADWLKVRPDEPGPLLLPIRKGGAIQSGRMSTQAVYEILRSRARKAGVKQFSPHDLRRTFVGSLLDAGADVSVVSKLAGHASVTTTARYDRRGEKAKRKAASLLHVPYRRRL